ncbi:unnamed protein product [Vitrella brassicaformis CCMP3155]|uniref:Uncharacterized protein n=1 Tax=Vitrella brassicaformis (strain CCMP3155) TaxID=1169540 RepID=A0A0G4H1W3_VITBC|nr:unnamed protein product [Vitrella brassicaformis CCMP3155]|eukprot:CEM37635.1 unnamed protein product [Vitrella brassicaformis CCMP3155]
MHTHHGISISSCQHDEEFGRQQRFRHELRAQPRALGLSDARRCPELWRRRVVPGRTLTDIDSLHHVTSRLGGSCGLEHIAIGEDRQSPLNAPQGNAAAYNAFRSCRSTPADHGCRCCSAQRVSGHCAAPIVTDSSYEMASSTQEANSNAAPVCHLLTTLPESCFSGHISPLLGTQTIITKLALTAPSLSVISRKPAMHITLRLGKDFSDKIDMTKQQIAVWGAAFRNTKHATMVCAPTTSVVELLEDARGTLEELHAWSHTTGSLYGYGPLKGRRQHAMGRDERIFPRLRCVWVAEWWLSVANKRHWELPALIDVHLRDSTVCYPMAQISEIEYGTCSGDHGWRCTEWLSGEGPHTLTLETGTSEGWELTNLWDMLKPSIKRLKGVCCPCGADELPTFCMDWNIADCGLQLDELHMVLKAVHPTRTRQVFHKIDKLLSTSLAPNGTFNITCTPDMTFNTIEHLELLQEHPSWAGMLTRFASAAQCVEFPSGLAQGEAVPTVVLYRLPQVVFSSAETLYLGAGSEPPPAALLSHISDRSFPHVTTLSLGHADGVREDAVRRATDLRSLREVRFEMSGLLGIWVATVPFLFPLCLGACSQTGPLLHVHADCRHTAVSFDCVWSLWGAGGGAVGQKGIEKRVQKITVEVHGASLGVSGILPVCLEAIDKCPFLDSIALRRSTLCFCFSGTVDRLGSDLQAVKGRMVLRGFVAVQVDLDSDSRSCKSAELCRVFGCLFPRGLREHMSLASLEGVCTTSRLSLDDTVSLPEAILAHFGLRFPRCVSRHLHKEWEAGMTKEIRSEWPELRSEARRKRGLAACG